MSPPPYVWGRAQALCPFFTIQLGQVRSGCPGLGPSVDPEPSHHDLSKEVRHFPCPIPRGRQMPQPHRRPLPPSKLSPQMILQIFDGESEADSPMNAPLTASPGPLPLTPGSLPLTPGPLPLTPGSLPLTPGRILGISASPLFAETFEIRLQAPRPFTGQASPSTGGPCQSHTLSPPPSRI